MASAVAANLRVYADRIHGPEATDNADDKRVAAAFMRKAAAQIEQHLRVRRWHLAELRKLRERAGSGRI
jgi:hypothetical protein